MSMSEDKVPTALSFRLRDHRFTALPVKDILKTRMKDLGIKNVDLQKALDYPMPNVIAMIKSGGMKLPAGKAVIAAKLLEVDPVFLLAKVVAESDPSLWDAISEVMGEHLITANELDLLKLVREGLDGHDVNLAESPEFIQAITPALNAIVERQNELARAALNRNDD
ncbi:hypothetical protein [Rhodoferax ferrireducens]|uniref:hypothetical protein n=1 Tax=Rhodoferax ferrireducens TaxID=192843 RepID=UPI003BB6E61C